MSRKQYNRLTYQDVKDIKFMDEHGMTQEEIAYAMDIDQSTVSNALTKTRRRYKREGNDNRGRVLNASGCSIKNWYTREDRGVVVVDTELVDNSDPTLEDAAILEFYENVIDEENE